MRAVPRRKPRVVRRSMSLTFPVKRRRPSSDASTAATGSAFRSRAERAAAPMRRARVIEPRTAHRRTSPPVRGALQVAAMEPTSVTAARPSRSCHFQLAARSTTTMLSRMSARQNGKLRSPAMAKVVIWASGNARPMQSASSTGSPVRAATRKPWSEFAPPISSGMTARNFRPRRSSMKRTGRAATSGSGRRSSDTSGAPMVETTATRSSSATASAGRRRGRKPAAHSARRFSSEWRGFPPPPAPRIQAPTARDSRSSGESSRPPEGASSMRATDATGPRRGRPTVRFPTESRSPRGGYARQVRSPCPCRPSTC